MGLDSLFSDKKIISLAAMIILLVGAIGELIVTIFWWSKLHPYYAHGNDEGKAVYQSLTASWVLALIAAIAIIVFLILMFVVSSVCDSITGNTIVLIVIMALVGGISLGSAISGFVAMSYAIKTPKLEDVFNEGNKNKCVQYLYYSVDSIEEWALKNGKDEDFWKFFTDLFKYIGLDLEDPDFDKIKFGKLCSDVGIPTLIFAIVIIIGIVVFIVALILSLTGFIKVN